jgi:hypothetical protein
MINAHDLAVEPKKINLKDADYSGQQQTRFNIESDALSITWNGSQTYGSNGRPNDSDHDN